MPVEKAGFAFTVAFDRAMSWREITRFNTDLAESLRARLLPKVLLDIRHYNSYELPGLQVADLAAWACFQQWERADEMWAAALRDIAGDYRETVFLKK